MSVLDRQREQLTSQLSPVLAALGFELDSLSLSKVGRRTLARITVDRDGGVDLDAIAEASRAIGAELDRDDPFETPFVLEVSSPGVDRPLTEPRHWRRNIGRLVSSTVDGRPVTGRVLAVGDDGVFLDVNGEKRFLPLAALGSGRVQVEFSHAQVQDPADGDAADEARDED
ncbi:MAG: ribosome maturation factor RimP [bacterium]